MKLSIVIVNYNVKHFLEQCLRSVSIAAEGIDTEVIVVDNASSDGSCDYLEPLFENVRFIRNKENKGFARANNQAILSSSGEYVLLLNPDTIIARDTLRRFIEFMDSHNDAGGAGAYMLRTDGTFAPESRRGLPTPFVAFCKMSGLSGLFPRSRIFGRYYMGYLDKEQESRIEIISGAFMFLRREALDKAGLLDEDFFMYGEDIDLSYRLLKAGYNNYFVPSRILHYKGESTEKSSYRYVYTFYQAMQLFFNKHFAHYSLLLSLPVNMAIWCRAVLAYIGNQLPRKKREKRALKAVVIGCKKALEDVRTILEREHPGSVHHFIEGNHSTCPNGHLGVEGAYDTVIYDTSSYEYKTMLELLEKTSGKKVKLATYSPQNGILIMENRTYQRQ